MFILSNASNSGASFNYPPVNNTGVYIPVPKKIKPQPLPVSGIDFFFAAVVLVFSVFFVSTALFSGFFKLGFTVSYVLYFIISTVYSVKKGDVNFSVYGITCGVLALSAAGVFTFFTDILINMILLVLIVFLNSMYLLSLRAANIYSGGSYLSLIDAIKFVFYIPFRYLPLTARSLFSRKGKNKKALYILLGILISVPIAAVVTVLLVSSDAAFEGLVTFVFKNIGLTFLKLVLGIAAFPFVFTQLFALRYDLVKNDKAMVIKDSTKVQKLQPIIGNTILCVVSVIYIIYLFSQTAYFFSAFSGFLPNGYSVSQYARRGFFEMCAVSVINAGIVYLSMLFLKRTDNKLLNRFSKALLIFISLFSVVFISTALSKMWMYINRYGLTYKRVLTSVFMIILIITFVLLILKIIFKKFPFAALLAVFVSAVVIAVGYADISRVCAKYNNYVTENRIVVNMDGYYAMDLDDSAIPYVVELVETDGEKLRGPIQTWLYDRWFEDYYEKHNRDEVKSVFAYNYSKSSITETFKRLEKKYNYKSHYALHGDKPYENGYFYNYEGYLWELENPEDSVEYVD